MISDEQMIAGWYGEIKHENDDQRRLMLDTGHLFEMHSVENIITTENVVKEIRSKYPPVKLFTKTFLTNTELLKKLRTHLTGMGIEPDPDENIATNARVSIKLAHLIYRGDDFKLERNTALNNIEQFFAKPAGNLPEEDNAANHSTDTVSAEPPNNDTNSNIDSQSSFEERTTCQIATLEKTVSTILGKMDQQQQFFLAQIQSLKDQNSKQDMVQEKSTTIVRSTRNKSDFESGERHIGEENSNCNEIKVSTVNNRIHHDIGQRFKSKESKYGGNDDEDLLEFLMTYETAAHDYDMTEEQKCRYVHNIFKEEALRHYNANVRDEASSYIEAKRLMLSHFNSPDVQARVKNELRTLKFQTFVTQNGTKAKALSAIASYIANRSRKCPPSYSHETHRVEFMKNALIKEAWAKPILMEITDSTKFQQLYTKLANALQFHEESEGNSTNADSYDGQKPLIFFTQPKYGREISGKLFSGYNNDKKCWNCDRPGHRHTQCRNKLDPVRIAAAKAKFLERKSRFRKPGMSSAKQVLYELAEELRDMVGGEENGDSDNPADTFFGNAPDESDSDDSTSDNDNQLTSEELFNLPFDEQDF